MCDQEDFDTMNYARSATASRRQLGALVAGAGLVSLLPGEAQAGAVSGASVEIRTPDGICDAYFTHPNAGTHPGVLMWPDIFGCTWR
jgi:carboxymethylenebutenolidase